MGPLSVTNFRSRYILIVSDFFTKYIKTAALPSVKATIIAHNHSEGILDWFQFSCEVAHYGKSLISVFEKFFASVKKILILAWRLGTRLSFYGV